MDSDTFYNRAFSRNRGLISSDEQLKLRNARVAIIGVGAVGAKNPFQPLPMVVLRCLQPGGET